MKLSECIYGKLVVGSVHIWGEGDPVEVVGMMVGIQQINATKEPVPLIQWQHGYNAIIHHEHLTPYEE